MLSVPSPLGQPFPGFGQSLPSPGAHGGYIQRQSTQEETITFQASSFTPPNTGGHRQVEGGAAKNRQLAIGGGLVGVLIIGGIVIYSSQNSLRTVSESNDSKTAQNAVNSNTMYLPSSFEREYAGTIGGRSFSLTLRRSGSDLSGSAYTSKTDTLLGTIDADGSFTLNGYENGERLSGIYTGRLLGDGTVVGSWTTPYGTKQTPFNLAQR